MIENAPERFKMLLKVLNAHRKSLEPAGASVAFLEFYEAFLKSLNKLSDVQIELLLKSPSQFSSAKTREPLQIPDVTALTLDELEKLILNEETPRKILETIAIKRFHVPKGSMRSFQNMPILREKLITRIQNEKAHHTIRDVARHSRS